MSADLICPHCGDKEEHDFTDRSDQDGEYEFQCSSCDEYFEVVNVWVREVTVVDACFWCDRIKCKCEG